MTEFLEREWWVRICVGDFLCLFTSFIMCKFGITNNNGLGSAFPTYLSNLFYFLTLFFIRIYSLKIDILIMSILTSVNLFFISILTGCTFTRNLSDGIFALFTIQYFFVYLILALVSGLTLIISYIYIAKFFQPIVSAGAYLFEPIIATIFIYVFSIQMLPGPFACLGYVFILPG